MEPAQDPGELFDLYDADGRPLGRAKPRRDVHRDGDWHKSVHIWVWGFAGGERSLVLQRRSAGKDTHPRKLDVAVTGHVRAGESIEATLREAEEEIGLHVEAKDLARLGLRRRVDRSKPGVIDNELQEIFVVVAPVEIAALRPSPAELEAIVLLPVASAVRVLRDGGEARGLRLVREGEGARFVGAEVEEVIRGGEMVPAPDGYYGKAIESVAVVLGGGRPEAWVIG